MHVPTHSVSSFKQNIKCTLLNFPPQQESESQNSAEPCKSPYLAKPLLDEEAEGHQVDELNRSYTIWGEEHLDPRLLPSCVLPYLKSSMCS